MKKLYSTFFALLLSTNLVIAQIKENDPISAESVKFYSELGSLVTECNCNDYIDKSIHVKIKISDEMFNYDLVTIQVRQLIDSKNGEGSGYPIVENVFGKSDFKNKYSSGSDHSIDLLYKYFCLDEDEEIVWNKYVVEVVGSNITSYSTVWDPSSKAYYEVPVYGEYDFLVRSEPFQFIQNQEAVRKKHDEERLKREQEEKESKRKEKLNKTIYIAGTAAAVAVIVAVFYFKVL